MTSIAPNPSSKENTDLFQNLAPSTTPQAKDNSSYDNGKSKQDFPDMLSNPKQEKISSIPITQTSKILPGTQVTGSDQDLGTDAPTAFGPNIVQNDNVEPMSLKLIGQLFGKGEQVLNKSNALSLVTGHFDNVTPDSIPRLISDNPFINSALSEGVVEFIQEKFPLQTLKEMFEIKGNVMNKAKSLGINPDEPIKVCDFLKALGIDPQRVVVELTRIKDHLINEDLNKYIASAYAASPHKEEGKKKNSPSQQQSNQPSLHQMQHNQGSLANDQQALNPQNYPTPQPVADSEMAQQQVTRNSSQAVATPSMPKLGKVQPALPRNTASMDSSKLNLQDALAFNPDEQSKLITMLNPQEAFKQNNSLQNPQEQISTRILPQESFKNQQELSEILNNSNDKSIYSVDEKLPQTPVFKFLQDWQKQDFQNSSQMPLQKNFQSSNLIGKSNDTFSTPKFDLPQLSTNAKDPSNLPDTMQLFEKSISIWNPDARSPQLVTKENSINFSSSFPKIESEELDEDDLIDFEEIDLEFVPEKHTEKSTKNVLSVNEKDKTTNSPENKEKKTEHTIQSHLSHTTPHGVFEESIATSSSQETSSMNFRDQLLHKIQGLVHQKGGAVIMDLGGKDSDLSLAVRTQGDQVHIRFMTRSDEVRRQLDGQMYMLEQSLKEQNLKLAGIEWAGDTPFRQNPNFSQGGFFNNQFEQQREKFLLREEDEGVKKISSLSKLKTAFTREDAITSQLPSDFVHGKIAIRI